MMLLQDYDYDGMTVLPAIELLIGQYVLSGCSNDRTRKAAIAMTTRTRLSDIPNEQWKERSNLIPNNRAVGGSSGSDLVSLY